MSSSSRTGSALIATLLFTAPCVAAFGPPAFGENDPEAVRMLEHEPHRLAEIAPEKFLYFNAAGRDGALDAASPAPLRVDAETIAGAAWRSHLVRAAHWFLGGGDEQGQPSATVIAAVMRAHAEVFTADELPPPHALAAMPTDLPEAVRECCAPLRLAFTIDGVRYSPPPSAMMRQWDEAYASWDEQRASQRAMDDLNATAQSLRTRVEEVAGIIDNSGERFEQFTLVTRHGRELLSADEYNAALDREIAWHEQHSPPWFALQLRLDGREHVEDDVMDTTRQMRGDIAHSFASVEIAAAITRASLRQGDLLAARSDVINVPGTTHGAAVRVEMFAILASEHPELRMPAIQIATRTAEKCELPQLRQRLLERIERLRADFEL